MPFTTIRLTIKTRNELRRLGRKGEEYESIVKRLIKDYMEECDIIHVD